MEPGVGPAQQLANPGPVAGEDPTPSTQSRCQLSRWQAALGSVCLGHSPSGIFGECFTLGNRPGIQRDRLLASQQRSHSRALEKKFSKVVLTAACGLHSPETASREGVRGRQENGSFSSGASGSQGAVSGELITSLDSSGRKRFGSLPQNSVQVWRLNLRYEWMSNNIL